MKAAPYMFAPFNNRSRYNDRKNHRRRVKNSTLYTKDAKCILNNIMPNICEAAKGRTRRNVTDCVRGSIYNFCCSEAEK